MSHKINLLDPTEIHYLSAAESNPLYKIAGLGVVTLCIVLAGLYVMSLRKTISEGENMAARWETIEADVAEAEALNTRKNRLEQGVQTLKGWSASRADWPNILQYLVDQTPGSLEDVQFTRLQMEETLRGLRNQAPGKSPADFHPLRREVDINLRGLLRSETPGRMLTRFQRNLLNTPDPPQAIEGVTLDGYIQLRDEKGAITDRTTFAFTIRLAPREVLP